MMDWNGSESELAPSGGESGGRRGWGGVAGGAALVSVGNNEMTQGGLQIQPQTPDPRRFLP